LPIGGAAFRRFYPEMVIGGNAPPEKMIAPHELRKTG
jgi:hypothetical protein